MTQARDLANLAGAADAGTVTGRNLIINGAMTVAQRGTVTGVTSAYGGPDRFKMSSGGSGEFTISQDTDVPSGQGFASSFKIDVTTADSSLAASDNAFWYQLIEGQNTQHIKKGTANAESLTLQFWIKSSTTGTYIVELYDNDNTRHISASYTVNSADTWEHKTVTFAGDTTGTIANDNTAGLHVGWWLAAGSTFSGGTLNTSWASNTDANRAVGQVNAIDDTANNIYFTGVQLEVGSTATPFEHEDFSTTLKKCERYYELVGSGLWNGSISYGFVGGEFSDGNCWLEVPWKTEKRTDSPAVAFINSFSWQSSPTMSSTGKYGAGWHRAGSFIADVTGVNNEGKPVAEVKDEL